MTEHSDDLLHIASCRTCRDRFTANNVVSFDADRHREPERVREFLETARRLERERAGMEDVVGRLLRITPPSEWSTLAGHPELRSSAAVEELIEEIRKRVERTPAEALTLANTATSIAETLAASAYPAVVLAQVRAMAWKERANTLRYLSRFDDALEAVETAEERLSDFAAVGFDRAVIQLSKAIILHHLGRSAEAYDLIRQARNVFRDHGDSKMLLFAGMIEGANLFNDSRFAEAHTVFNEMRDVARELRDKESLARIENNLGYCATHFGDFRAANIHLSNGIALFNDIGSPIEATRAEHGAGLLLVAKGQINAGLAYLRSARRAFSDSGLAEEAAICGLEIVEILFQRGDASEARDLAHRIAVEVETAGLSERAITALRRLGDTLREGGSEAVLQIRDVHAVLKSLQDERETPAQ